jgi:DNA excision repair protein ERCC-4
VREGARIVCSILRLDPSLATQPSDLLAPSDADTLLLEAILASETEMDYDMHYGLLVPSQTVVVRAYTDDTDDQILAELQPRFIVMFEPNLDFVRRIEVSPSSKSDWHP